MSTTLGQPRTDLPDLITKRCAALGLTERQFLERLAAEWPVRIQPDSVRRRVEQWATDHPRDDKRQALARALELPQDVVDAASQPYRLKGEPPPSIELWDQAWLGENRARVLTLSRNMLVLLRAQQEVIAKDSQARRAAGLLTGAVASLWEAIFLNHNPADQTDEKNLTDALRFLELLVESKRVYGDDMATRIWKFGFHLNNAKYRIQRLLSDKEKTAMARYGALLDDELSYRAESLREMIGRSIHDWGSLTNAWQGYYDATQLGYDCFAAYYRSP